MSATRPARSLLAASLLAASLLAGCVSVPTSGPVSSVDEPPTVGATQVNDPAGPAPGASREEIALGFLAAMEAFPVSTDRATEFLTDPAAQRWRPQRRTVVYDAPSARALPDGRVAVDVREVASLTRRGTFLPPSGSAPVQRPVFSMARVDGAWRIDDLPDALFIRRYFFEDTYQSFDLFFPDPSGSALLADPVFLPVGTQLATRLVQGLLAGPTRWLGDQATAAVPRDAEVEVSVPLQPDGVADVQLSQPVAEISPERLQLLSAQLVWTLGQVDGIEGVRITVEGVPLSVEGAGVVQSLDAWPQYDPNGTSLRGQLYALHRGALRLVGDGDGDGDPVAGVWGRRGVGLTDFSVDRYVSLVGALDQTRSRLLQGPVSAEDATQVDTRYTGRGTLSDPQWDRTGQLWVLDHGARATRWVVADDQRAVSVPAGRLGQADVTAMAISPDGARVAALVDNWNGPLWGGGTDVGAAGEAVVVARVVRAADGHTVRRLDQAYAVQTQAVDFTNLYDIDWGAPSRVAVLADVGRLPAQPFELPVDASSVLGAAASAETVIPDVEARTLATVGLSGAQTVVGDAEGNLLVPSTDQPWSVLAEALRRPHYPS